MSIAGSAQLRQDERLLTGGEGDHNRRRHSGNNSPCGKLALAGIAESTLLCQSFVVWFSHPLCPLGALAAPPAAGSARPRQGAPPLPSPGLSAPIPPLAADARRLAAADRRCRPWAGSSGYSGFRSWPAGGTRLLPAASRSDIQSRIIKGTY